MKTTYAFALILIILAGCSKKVNNTLPSTLIDNYCLNGPESCKTDKVDVIGYLDGINIYENKFFLWAALKDNNSQQKNRFIEVYYPNADLSKIFDKKNDHYSANFKVKVIVRDAEIKTNKIATSKVTTINYLQLNEIHQVDFYKIDEKGKLKKLDF